MIKPIFVILVLNSTSVGTDGPPGEMSFTIVACISQLFINRPPAKQIRQI